MRESRWLWPRSLLFCVSCALVPGMASLAQDRQLVLDQIVVQPRGLPQLAPEGVWGEIINVTSRWVVIQNQSGQQYPIGIGDLGEFLVRWPSSRDALGNQSVVEAIGPDLGNNVVETRHVDVFEGGDSSLVTPTYYNSLLPSPAMIINSWDYTGQNSIFSWPLLTSPSLMGAPVVLHAVGNVVNRDPLQLKIPGNNIASVVAPFGEQLTITQVTRGAVSYIKKGDYAFLMPKEITPRGLVLSQFILYKTIAFPLFNPAR
jgi:hypothetical protein